MSEVQLRVLFLCVHNSARSQIAEGLLRQMAGERIEVHSAGSEPSQVNPFARQVLEARGVDTRAHFSKSVREFVNQPFDFVITLCDDEVCPVFPGAATRLHWKLSDPSAVPGDPQARIAAFEHTAALLETRLIEFLASHDKTTPRRG